MIRAIINFIISIVKAIFKLKDSIQIQQDQQDQQNQQQFQELQQNLQTQYDKIDEEHKINPNPTLQEIEDKLNDRF